MKPNLFLAQQLLSAIRHVSLVVRISGKKTIAQRTFHACFPTLVFLRATAGTAIARLSHRNSVRPSVRLSVRLTGGSGKSGAS